jgi:FkbM family methyltransferase
MKIVENRVMNHKMFFLKDGGGIHKMRNWKDRPGVWPREPEFNYVMTQELQKGMVVVDLGANIGFNTLLAASIVKNGRGHVYAIEPDPRNTELLSMSVKANGYEDCVSVHQVAISDTIGFAKFYLSDATNLNSLTPTHNTKGDVIGVQVTTLEAFMMDKGIPNFIKMDIEGAETTALKGMLPMFAKPFPCKILMEVHPQFYTEEDDLVRPVRELLKLGFVFKYINSAAVPVPDKFREAGYQPIKVFDSGRGLYDATKMKVEDCINFSCLPHKQKMGGEVSPKIVRSVLWVRQ